MPRLHGRFDFLQFIQIGVASSHLRCLDLHVRHPVRTLLGLVGETFVLEADGCSSEPSGLVGLSWGVCEVECLFDCFMIAM